MLSLYLSLVIFQLGCLHYRVCYRVSLHLAEKHFPENHLSEKHFPERSFSRINNNQKSHLPE